MKKTIICSILALILIFSQSQVYASTLGTTESDVNKALPNSNEKVEEIKINKELDKLIMNVDDEIDRDKIFDYFYLPAYSKVEILDEGEKATTNFKAIEQENLAVGKLLCSKSGKDLDNELRNLVNKGADQILAMDNIEITEEYCKYVDKYLPKAKVTSINDKRNDYINKIASNSENNTINISEDNDVNRATTKTKTFKKEYGSPSAAAYTIFTIKVTWKYTSSTITSLSTSGQSITTPYYMQTTLQRNKTYISSNNKYGYVQRGWGYVNLLYMDGKINGYYIIDVKLNLGSVTKNNLTTLSPLQWSAYSWG